MQGKLPEGSQTHFRSIVTHQYLRVLGSEGSIYAMYNPRLVLVYVVEACHVRGICSLNDLGGHSCSWTLLACMQSASQPANGTMHASAKEVQVGSSRVVQSTARKSDKHKICCALSTVLAKTPLS